MPSSPPRRRRASLLGLAVPPAAALVLLLAAWEALTRAFGVPAWLLPPPSAVARAGGDQLGTLAAAAVITARATLAGFLLSAAVGVLTAIVLASSRSLERALYPYMVFFQTVPILAVAPLLVIWFGYGLHTVSLAAFIVSVFPVITNTLAGLRSVEPALRDLFRLYGARRLATLVKLELPSALPSIVTGLRIAAGLAVIGAIAGEWVAGYAEGGAGLGILVLSSGRQLRTDLLFAAVLCAAGLGVALFGAVSLLGTRLLRRWHPSARG